MKKMAKNIAEFKNPFRANSVNPLNPMDYVSAIGYVAWIGLVMVLGAKALVAADKVLPGDNTPAQYKSAVAAPATTGGVTVI